MRILPVNNYQTQNQQKQSINFSSNLQLGEKLIAKGYDNIPDIQRLGNQLFGDGKKNLTVTLEYADSFLPMAKQQEETILQELTNSDNVSEAVQFLGNLGDSNKAAGLIKQYARASYPYTKNGAIRAAGNIPDPQVRGSLISELNSLPGEFTRTVVQQITPSSGSLNLKFTEGDKTLDEWVVPVSNGSIYEKLNFAYKFILPKAS